MAQLDIRKDFVDGVLEVYSTMFNEGKTDGIDLYLLSKGNFNETYRENKYKVYKPPIRLIARAILNPTQENLDIDVIKDKATFKVPLKALQEKGVDVSHENLEVLRKGVIVFQGIYFKIENILPRTYVEDVFLMYDFICSEDKQMSEIVVE